jgi:hypothetical protein
LLQDGSFFAPHLRLPTFPLIAFAFHNGFLTIMECFWCHNDMLRRELGIVASGLCATKFVFCAAMLFVAANSCIKRLSGFDFHHIDFIVLASRNRRSLFDLVHFVDGA